jgi:hypothetical protein
MLKLNLKNITTFFSIFIFLTFITPTIVNADVLLPGNINTCGELAISGTYTLTTDLNTSGTSTCLTISSDNVTIVGNNHTISGTGDIAIDGRARVGGPDGILDEGMNGSDNLIISNLIITGFTNGVNTSGNSSITGQGGNGGNVNISASTIINITSNGGDGISAGASIGGNVTVSGDSNVDEVYSVGGISRHSFIAQGLGNKNWRSITSAPDGDVYAVLDGEKIYKQNNGTGAFVIQNSEYSSWTSITSTPSGDVYAVAYGEDIYKQTRGIGDFVSQGAGYNNWISITSTPSGDVYAVVANGDIYKQINGTGDFVAQNAGDLNWYSITSTPSGDVYAGVSGGDIYKQTNGTGDFVSQGAGDKNWYSITSTPSGDAYAVAYGDDVYKQTSGTGAFVAQGAGNKNWSSITSTPSGDVYIAEIGGNIYKQTGGVGAWITQGAGLKIWLSITSTPSGDVYAVVFGGDIYKKVNTYAPSGTITLNGNNLDISNKTYTAGTLNIINSGTLTYTNTYVSISSHLIINGVDYGPYTGIIPSVLPGPIDSCKTITMPGTYTLSSSISSVSGTCFNIKSNNVTINGNGNTITAQNGNTSYAIVATSSISGSPAYTNTTIQNLTISGFTNAVNTSGNSSTTGQGDNGGSISIISSTLGNINSSGGNGGVTSGGTGGNVTVSADSSVGVVNSSGGSTPGPFTALGAGVKTWQSITSTPNGDVYAVVKNGDIYKQTGGVGAFVAQNAGALDWWSITSTPSGDVYAGVSGGGIYKQTGGTGSFVEQNAVNVATPQDWFSITSTPSGDVYAVAFGYDIYKQTGGTGSFVPLNVGALFWTSIISTPSGDVYVTAMGGDIYKQTGGTGSFVAQNAGIRDWISITYTSKGDLYAAVYFGDIYKKTGGAGSWVAQNLGSIGWTSITSTPSGDVYAVSQDDSIYKQALGTGAFVQSEAEFLSWWSITSTPSGDVYVVGSNTDIYKVTPAFNTGAITNIISSQTESINTGSGILNIRGDNIDLSNKTYSSTGGININYTGSLNTSSSTNIFTSTANFNINNTTYKYPSTVVSGYNGVYNPSIYYFRNVIDTNWNTLGNWCITAYCGQANSTPAITLPTLTDQVNVNGDILSNSGPQAQADTVVFNGTSTNSISINAVRGTTFNASSTNIGTTTLPLVNFNDTSINTGTVFSTIATFYNNTSSAILGSFKGASATGAFVDQGAGNKSWQSITSTPSGDIYAVVTGGDIYKRIGGVGAWIAQGAGNKNWHSVTSTPSGDVYAAVYANITGGGIYKQTGGTGAFVEQGAGNKLWQSITSTPSGDVYAVVYSQSAGNGIYKQTGGTGAFVTQGAGNKYWYSITSTPSGDVYAAVYSPSGGGIYKQTGGSGSFVSQGAGDKYWSSVVSTLNGDVYATAANSDNIYKQTGGSGPFISQEAGNLNWQSIALTPSGDIYSVARFSNIYKQTGGVGSFVEQNSGYPDWISITSTPSGDVYAVVNGGGIYKQSASHPVLQRVYNQTSTSTRIFASTTESAGESGHSDWIIIAQRAVGSLIDVVVDLTNATYNLLTNIFKAFTGARFISGTDINGLTTSVVPDISISSPTEGQNVTKWLPSINWGNSTVCKYSYDNFVSSSTANCASNGTDLPRPVAGAHTLTIRGINQYGSYTENAINFTYDNTSPTWTSCGSDLLNESTRQYYYLASSTVGSCTATVDTKLYGNIQTTDSTVEGIGFTVNGDFNGNGHTITLKNITVTGTITSNSGIVTIQNATTSAIVVTATSTGIKGGTVNVSTSTTGTITANGADGINNGSDGGTITVYNSDGSTTNTVVTANGGNSTSCGNGGNAGIINITNSDNYTAIANVGVGSNNSCPSRVRTSGSTVATPIVTPRPIVTPTTPPSVDNTNTNPNRGRNITYSGTIDLFINPNLKRIIFNETQKFNLFNKNNKPQNTGATILPDIFKDLNTPEALILTPAPTNFLTNLYKFTLNNNTPDEKTEIEKYLLTQGIDTNKEQDLAKLNIIPIKINTGTIKDSDKLLTITSNKNKLATYITYSRDTKSLAQLVKVTSGQNLIINNQTDNKSLNYKAPNKAGRYVVDQGQDNIPLVVEVISEVNKTEVKSGGLWNWVKGLFR